MTLQAPNEPAPVPLKGKAIKESNICRVVAAASGSILEVGIGGAPQIPRLQQAMDQGMTYLGLDFEKIADLHREKLRRVGMGEYLDNGRIAYFTNTAGTYNYTLLKLVREKRLFDLVFLDGHHAFDTDLPAAILCAALLKERGLFMLDDVYWTLNKVKRLMAEKPELEAYYRDVYRFSDYAPEQMPERGIQAIIEDVLIPHLGFAPHALSWEGVAVLQKGAEWEPGRTYPWLG